MTNRRKSKTVAAWLAFLGGPIGLHRFYLHGAKDWLGWLLPVPTFLGIWGIARMLDYGQDDTTSWMLIPLLGFVIAGCALQAIVFGLATPEQWNARYNPAAPTDDSSGRTHWGTIAAIVTALLVGTGVLMASLAFSFQRYFEFQIEEARKLSQ
ncbi:TM2 domain-containing protein [Tibeticola sediminis]|uniref:TM2 domain-containing protein n=1 Tax=Tibeticola sediminis TaxID=1917811 RepID=A0A3N4U2P6_9BURK|nr:TM2 domain-containing protein [Tibeticola sediminis]RPE65126.1 TM2 domain-containing protein [Tibeticola sediminis]